MGFIGFLFVFGLACLALVRLGQHLGDPERKRKARARKEARPPGWLGTTTRNMTRDPKRVPAGDVFWLALGVSVVAWCVGATGYAAVANTGVSHAAAPGIAFLGLVYFGFITAGAIFWGPAAAAALLWKLIVWPKAQPKPQKPVSYFLSGGPTERQLLEQAAWREPYERYIDRKIAYQQAPARRGLIDEDQLAAAIADALNRQSS